jgi:hypothetical protein
MNALMVKVWILRALDELIDELRTLIASMTIYEIIHTIMHQHRVCCGPASLLAHACHDGLCVDLSSLEWIYPTACGSR